MSTTIALPPKLVPHMREAMIFELGQAGRTIALESALKDPRLDEPLHRFDTARGVLDALPDHLEREQLRRAIESLQRHARELFDTKRTAEHAGDPALANRRQGELEELEAGLDELLTSVRTGLG
jgi:hypothetical protein